MTKANPFGNPTAEDDGFSVDLTEVSNGFQIEAGDYPAKLVDVVQGTSKAGNPMFTWTFVIVGDKYAGREFKTFTALSPQALWKVAEVLTALGIEASGKMVNFKKADVLNKRVLLDIQDDTYNGETRSQIKKVKEHPDGPVMPKVGDPLASPKKKSKAQTEDISF